VLRFVHGTVGYDDEYLPGPGRGGRKLTDAKAFEVFWRYDHGLGGVTQQVLADEYRVSRSTVGAPRAAGSGRG
jgi:hypothetical protein